jgi:hypothetical protein
MGCRERRIYWLQEKWSEKVNRLQGEIGSEEERRFFGSKGKSKKEKDSPAAEEDQEKWFTTRFKASEFFWKETFHLFQGRWRNDWTIYTQEVDFLVVHHSKKYGFFRFKTTLKKWFTNLFSKNTKEKQLGMYTEVFPFHVSNYVIIWNLFVMWTHDKMQVQHKSKKKNQTAERPSVLGIGKTFRSWFGLTILWIKLKFNNTKNNFILKRKFEDVLLARMKSENENISFFGKVKRKKIRWKKKLTKKINKKKHWKFKKTLENKIF